MARRQSRMSWACLPSVSTPLRCHAEGIPFPDGLAPEVSWYRLRQLRSWTLSFGVTSGKIVGEDWSNFLGKFSVMFMQFVRRMPWLFVKIVWGRFVRSFNQEYNNEKARTCL